MDVQKQDDLIKEAFEIEAEEIGFCLDQLWGDYENPYENSDTALAFNLFKKGWLAKAQAVPEWISMEDRYPKAGESVLICINGIRQNIAYFYDYSASDEYSTGHDWFEPVFTGGETEDECVVKTEDVTHWMLLPQEPTND